MYEVHEFRNGEWTIASRWPTFEGAMNERERLAERGVQTDMQYRTPRRKRTNGKAAR
jgi:hypothetical protein